MTNTNLPKRQFGKRYFTKSKVQQIFVAKSTIRRDISMQFQIFRQIVLRQILSPNCTFCQIYFARLYFLSNCFTKLYFPSNLFRQIVLFLKFVTNLNSSNCQSSNCHLSKSPEIIKKCCKISDPSPYLFILQLFS